MPQPTRATDTRRVAFQQRPGEVREVGRDGPVGRREWLLGAHLGVLALVEAWGVDGPGVDVSVAHLALLRFDDF